MDSYGQQPNVYSESDSEQESDLEQELELNQDQWSDSDECFSLERFRNLFKSPAKKRSQSEPQQLQTPSHDWVRLGRVKHLLIYPVDRGTGLIEKSVICSNNGPEFNSSNPSIRGVKDRCLVIYKDKKNKICLKPEDVMINYNSKMNFYYGDVENNHNNTIRVLTKVYDNISVPIHVRNNDIYCNELRKRYQMKNRNFKVGYLTAEHRNQLIGMHKYRHENFNVSGLHVNYSHYTLVNTRTIEAIKNKFKDQMKKEKRKINARHLTYLNFFPHIVVEGDNGSQYQEDHISSLKIGNVIFDQINPCIHDEADLRLNHTNQKKPFKHIYEFLKKERLIGNTHSELSHDDQERAVVGINMERAAENLPGDENNTISKNDVVYVKFGKISNPQV